MWNRPYASVIAASPRRVTTRTPPSPASPGSWSPLRFWSSKTLPITSVQSKVGSGTTRTVAWASPDKDWPVRALDGPSAVHELALGDAGADGEQELQGPLTGDRHVEVAPDELRAVDRRLGRHAVDPRGSLDVAEARGEAVDDADVLEVRAELVAEDDLVRHELAAADVDRRRRLRDPQGAAEHAGPAECGCCRSGSCRGRGSSRESDARSSSCPACAPAPKAAARTRRPAPRRSRACPAPRRRRCPDRWGPRAAGSKHPRSAESAASSPRVKVAPGATISIR